MQDYLHIWIDSWSAPVQHLPIQCARDDVDGLRTRPDPQGIPYTGLGDWAIDGRTHGHCGSRKEDYR
jgi:hypothetical protein